MTEKEICVGYWADKHREKKGQVLLDRSDRGIGPSSDSGPANDFDGPNKIYVWALNRSVEPI